MLEAPILRPRTLQTVSCLTVTVSRAGIKRLTPQVAQFIIEPSPRAPQEGSKSLPMKHFRLLSSGMRRVMMG